MKKSDSEKILSELKKTLILANKQVRGKSIVSSDKLKNLARLSNAYSKLVLVSGLAGKSEPERDVFEHGDAHFYESLQE